ncbi:hypothetical protein QE345_gp115 [Pseudomonas phage vB_PA45_GUMS]|uniref:Uncharacterized protein n=1 Tax=Pseudomonas phage vB_PA45_GUMS TaxID=2656517 RepID=A0A8T8BGQ5_9CAUD|nr:hypothetical protein QE345_gp115 [Pseudomonas phage vB_PA45_GUMS]QGK90274.1 hypothetical protein [Pseudomonas phage vB_PA45_GUMS]
MGDKTVVYRVECRNGEGPYVNYGMEIDTSSTPERPVPEHDGIPDVRHFEYFAFTSPKQLDDWFGDYYSNLTEHSSASIKMYEVDRQHVRTGIRQCVFRKDAAVCVKEGTIAQWVGLLKAGMIAAVVTQALSPIPAEQLSLDLGLAGL